MSRRGNQGALFVPLKREHFDAFCDGSKTTEFRLYGPRWNENTCTRGRDVVLSCGYNGPRLHASIVSFERVVKTTDTYGPNRELAAIHLLLTRDHASIDKDASQ